jgi:uncharacterized protein
MLYNVAQLLKASAGSDLRQDFDGDVSMGDDGVMTVSPIRGQARFQKTNQGILAAGDFTVTVRLQCVRCLDDFEQTLHIPFSEMYLPTVEVVTGRPIPDATKDDESFPIDAHHHLNLTEMVRQQIILNLPAQPLCRTDCLGICAICGGNRNERACDCEAQQNLQWQALTTLTLDELPPSD